MSTSTAQSIDDLLQVLQKGEAIVIAGTGVSASVACSNKLIRSWSLLLKHGIDFCCSHAQDINEISESCRTFDATSSASLDELLAIGDEVQQYLIKNNLMERWLEVVFAGLSPEDQRLIRALEKLKVPIATTNYDRLFEDITGLPGISWRDTAKLHRFLNGQEQAILHLHGHFRDPNSIILGKRSYDELLEQEFALFAEKSLFSRYNVIFIGFGDSTKDPNFSRLLTWSRAHLSATQVFRVVRQSELDKLREEHQTLGYNIQLISYGADYSDLTPFLERLAYQLPVVPPIPKNLPAVPDNIGRGELIETVVDKLVRPGNKPIGLLGGAGIGKSNTILNVLYHRKTAIQFGEQRYFVRCEAVTTSDLLWSQTLDTLGLQPSRDLSPQQQVEHFLVEQPTLLVFDNAETPWERFGPVFESILGRLKSLTNLRLVVTYRGKAIPGTRIGWDSITVPALTEEQSRALFLNLTGEVFANDPALPRLLRAVDYLPLAVTLLAERAKDEQRLAALEQKWEQRKTDLLKLDPANKDLNLEVSILLSFDSPRLSDTGRELFKALCWLPDGIQRADWESAFPDYEDDLNALLRVVLAEEDSIGRVRVLAPIREVINRKFSPDPLWLEPTVRKIVNIAAESGRQVSFQEGAFTRVQAEWLNLNQIFSKCDYTEWLIDALTDLTLFSSFSGLYLTNFLTKAAQITKTNQWQQLQANCLRSLGGVAFLQSDNARAITYYEQAQPLYEQVGDLLGKANCLRSLGDVAFRQSDNARAITYYEQAQPLYEQVGDLLGKANCLKSLGDVAFRQSDNARAITYYEQAQPLYEQVGDLLGKANCLKSLGDVAFLQSDNARAITYYEQAQPLYEQVGDLLGKANCLKSLGDVAFRQSDNARAITYYEQAQPLYEQVGDLLGKANCLKSLGDVAFRQSDNARAITYYEQAQPLYEQVGDLLGKANCLRSLGDVAFRQSDNARAITYYEQAQPLYEQVGDLLGKANCLKSLGDVAFLQSDNARAITYYEQAQPLYEQVGDLLGKANCLKSLGDVAFLQSDNARAITYYEQAQPLYEQVGDLLGKANCLKSLGDVAFRQSDNARAITYYEQAQPLYEQVGDLLGKANCLKSLGDVAFLQSDNARAITYYEQAQPLYEQVGDLLGKANCLKSLGDVAFRQSDSGGGDKLYEVAIRLYNQINDHYSLGRAYYYWSLYASDDTIRQERRCKAKTVWEGVNMHYLVEQTGLTDACQ
ncbi:tetratricopeptide repeat protein [Spirosoma taeanense]|uniref:Tetratricopeptide repeat protein n=1 Tax=Spirosoma taeanense TaxID=2735870 RepID=A0A6M5Y145_9BACT|nr:tetratricopeptide repeat protein [Spirosoma taeanense]QJW88478.1 tetratricopeptide repeat protein [Spirosoma taeanense]